MMRISSATGDFVELERSGDQRGDLLIIARVRCGEFIASVDAWVLQTAWFAFAQQLTILEERRQGEARLDATSPGELELVFRSLDRVGHMGVEGLIGTHSYDRTVAL